MSLTPIYLDNNAAAPMRPEVVGEVERVWRTAWGNPGSRHTLGRAARAELESARETTAALLGASPDEVVFTSGATEANNLAIQGLARSEVGRMALLPGEHPSLDAPAHRLEGRGWRRVWLPLSSDGDLGIDRLGDVDWNGIRLAAIVIAHSETGTIRNFQRLSAECDQRRIPLHFDGVQAAGKIPLRFRDLGCVTLSVAAHKFGGPRGIGALIIRKGVKLRAEIVGGLQEQERRAGTESVALAAGMARALSIRVDKLEREVLRIGGLRDRFEKDLQTACPPVWIHAAQAPRLPNTSHVAFPGCDSDALLAGMDLAGICCSIGTACASGATEPSPILIAMGCPAEILSSSVRFSLGTETTEEEITEAVRRIASVVTRLRRG